MNRSRHRLLRAGTIAPLVLLALAAALPGPAASRAAGLGTAEGRASAAGATARAEGEESIVEQVRKSRRALISSLIGSPTGDPGGAELEETIKRIEAIRLGLKKPEADAGQETTSAAEGETPGAPGAPRPTKPAAGITPEELARLKALPTERIANPLGLADALFLGGYLEEAYAFYERLLTGGAEAEAKAWALLQMANCRRPSDPDAAAALYARVAAEHPTSPWAEVARTHRVLIEWHKTAQPGRLLGSAAAPRGTAGLPSRAALEAQSPSSRQPEKGDTPPDRPTPEKR